MWRRALSTRPRPPSAFAARQARRASWSHLARLAARGSRRAGAAAWWRPDQSVRPAAAAAFAEHFNRKQNDPKDPTDSAAGFRVKEQGIARAQVQSDLRRPVLWDAGPRSFDVPLGPWTLELLCGGSD